MAEETASRAQPTAKEFWRVLGERAIGATIVTAGTMLEPCGFFCLSAAHVCADPPTLLISVDHATAAHGAIASGRRFVINVAPAEAAHVIDLFIGERARKGVDRFVREDWRLSAQSPPILKNALAVFDCRVEQTMEIARTTIFIGRATTIEARGRGGPLIYFRGAPL